MFGVRPSRSHYLAPVCRDVNGKTLSDVVESICGALALTAGPHISARFLMHLGVLPTSFKNFRIADNMSKRLREETKNKKKKKAQNEPFDCTPL